MLLPVATDKDTLRWLSNVLFDVGDETREKEGVCLEWGDKLFSKTNYGPRKGGVLLRGGNTCM